jgi:hypothetical protein
MILKSTANLQASFHHNRLEASVNTKVILVCHDK